MKNIIILVLIFLSADRIIPQTDSTKFKGGNGSGYSMAISQPIALPVELSSFTGAFFNDKTILRWETKTEIRNYGFDIERVISDLLDTKKISYKKIGFVSGNGNSNSPKKYSFTDESNLDNGKYLYRLKQIDTDGAFGYSNIVEVDVSRNYDFALLQNYPNPFNPSTTITFQLQTKEFVSLKIYNVLGNEVAVLLNESLPAGKHDVTFDGSNIASGVYFYKITAGSFTDIKKLTLLK